MHTIIFIITIFPPEEFQILYSFFKSDSQHGISGSVGAGSKREENK